LYISPGSSATSILHVKTPEKSSGNLPISYQLPIRAKITIPNFTIYGKNITVATNSLTGNITKNFSNLTVTLLKPLTSQSLMI
jgi:hypothetical protein